MTLYLNFSGIISETTFNEIFCELLTLSFLWPQPENYYLRCDSVNIGNREIKFPAFVNEFP